LHHTLCTVLAAQTTGAALPQSTFSTSSGMSMFFRYTPLTLVICFGLMSCCTNIGYASSGAVRSGNGISAGVWPGTHALLVSACKALTQQSGCSLCACSAPARLLSSYNVSAVQLTLYTTRPFAFHTLMSLSTFSSDSSGADVHETSLCSCRPDIPTRVSYTRAHTPGYSCQSCLW
jgi:hypothetical protein